MPEKGKKSLTVDFDLWDEIREANGKTRVPIYVLARRAWDFFVAAHDVSLASLPPRAGSLNRGGSLHKPGSLMNALIDAALGAREHAEARFSNFKVGAALLDSAGRIHTGCNVENATYGLTVCAERVAVFKAISEGVRKFKRVAVAADTAVLTPPCGACRQILWEFCGDIEVVLVNLEGKTESLRLKDLFPRPFDASFVD